MQRKGILFYLFSATKAIFQSQTKNSNPPCVNKAYVFPYQVILGIRSFSNHHHDNNGACLLRVEELVGRSSGRGSSTWHNWLCLRCLISGWNLVAVFPSVCMQMDELHNHCGWMKPCCTIMYTLTRALMYHHYHYFILLKCGCHAV